jgi:hypothetical protein
MFRPSGSRTTRPFADPTLLLIIPDHYVNRLEEDEALETIRDLVVTNHRQAFEQ